MTVFALFFSLYTEDAHVVQVRAEGPKVPEAARPERAEAHSPGQRPGLLRMIAYRPVRAKALKLLTIYKAFALTGRLANCHYTQGVALG